MKNKTLRGLLRLAAFGLCFVPVLLFANTFLIKTDTYARLTLAEMKQRSDIDMVFVGSSIVRDHFNAEMITKETGKLFAGHSLRGAASRSGDDQRVLPHQSS